MDALEVGEAERGAQLRKPDVGTQPKNSGIQGLFPAIVYRGRSATQTAAADAEKALVRKRKAEDRGFSVLLVTGASGLGKREGFLGSRACGAAAPVSCRLLTAHTGCW